MTRINDKKRRYTMQNTTDTDNARNEADGQHRMREFLRELTDLTRKWGVEIQGYDMSLYEGADVSDEKNRYTVASEDKGDYTCLKWVDGEFREQVEARKRQLEMEEKWHLETLASARRAAAMEEELRRRKSAATRP
jgi:hypothetical protein